MRTRSIVGVVAALVAATSVAAAEEPAAGEYRSVEITAGHFRCEAPEGWHFDRDEREEARIHYHGFSVDGPKGDEAIGPALSIRFFAPDNTLFRGAPGYLDRQLRASRIKLAGEKTSEARDVMVAVRPAKTFTRDTFEFFPPESMDAAKIPVREEHFVAPHLGGFVLVRFEAPTRSYASSRKALAHVLETLRLLPETTLQTVRITAPGLGPEEMEMRGAHRAETRLEDLADVVGTWSASFRGESVLVLAFKSTADLPAARQEILRRLVPLYAGLPNGTEMTLLPALPGEGPALSLTFSTSDASNSRPVEIARLTALAERTVRSRIAVIPGVAQAAFTGAMPRYEVIASPERLAENNVDLRELVAAVRGESKPAGGVERKTSIDELARRTVARTNGKTVTVGDLAEVRLAAFEPRFGGERSADQAAPDAAAGAVRLTVRNTADIDGGYVYRAVDGVLDEIRPALPAGVSLERRLVTPAANPVWETLGIARGRMVLKISGADLTAATHAADEVRNGLQKIRGLVDLAVVPAAPVASLRLTIRREQARRYGFDDKSIDEIDAVVGAVIARRPVASIAGPHALPIDVSVTASGDEPAAIGRLTFRTPEGMSVPLRSIADLSLVAEPAVVLHEQGKRVVLVTGRFAGGDRAKATREIEAYCRTIRMSEGLSIETVKND